MFIVTGVLNHIRSGERNWSDAYNSITVPLARTEWLWFFGLSYKHVTPDGVKP